MGRDIIAAGALGVLAVIVVTVWHETILWVASWPRRYVRARGYEHELARHTAAGLRAELDWTPTYATVTIPRADVAGEPPWSPAEPVDYDPGRYGLPVPEWADPYADRYTGYGGNSGSGGSDYHGGELPAAREGGRPPAVTGEPGSESFGTPGPATYPFGDAPEDAALDETWARLERAWLEQEWAQPGSAGIPPPARDPDSGAVERGREDDGSTGTATRARELGSLSPLGITGRGGVVPVTPAAAPGSRDATAVASPGPGSRLGTRFDVELAAECAHFIREQDADVTGYLERLLGVTW